MNLVLRLEKKIGQLLDRKAELEEGCRRLQAEKSALMKERERFCRELDRILAKLDRLEQDKS
jgi:chromosome segregation ATPase